MDGKDNTGTQRRHAGFDPAGVYCTVNDEDYALKAKTMYFRMASFKDSHVHYIRLFITRNCMHTP
jgi:hypothetical protein